ncbi:MAG: hypothetical protein ABI639_06320 [Thermoanaerobaculia bacterium]
MNNRAPVQFFRSLALIGSIAAVLSAEAIAQAPLQVVDSNGTLLGPVIGTRPDSSGNLYGYYFVYDQGGQSAVLVAENSGRLVGQRSQIYLYFTSINCDNAPAVATMIDCCAAPLLPIVIPNLNELWRIDQTATVDPLVVARRPIGTTQSSGACELLAPANYNGHPVTSFGTLNFVPPISVERNPFLFGDDFSSVSLDAWSNY